MLLSIIIVNYNVKHFLQQCLTSVYNASKKAETEVWVVDNNSVDGSVQMVKKFFPNVKLIENKENYGFSKANNQAIKKAKGKYVLLLNPDTIVEESTFEKTIEFMEKHKNAGGLGVKMIDGKGKFLPESKRGIPYPKVAFYKMSGLINLFPKSKKIAKYYMGHLSSDETGKIEIISGAFMLLRKSVIDKIGLLDETFFMYGEDIDLSYRILQAGFDNYYFSNTTIVHYKGESTKKGSLNYVYVFYNAMIIFAKKHFAKKNAKLFMLIIKMAIFFRAGLSAIRRLLSKISLPLFDFIMIFAGFVIFVPIWERYHLEYVSYPNFIWFMLPGYILIWLFTSFFYGAYDNPIKIKTIFSGISVGTIVILVLYALIDSKYRFSRLIIVLGALYSAFIMVLIRLILNKFKRISNVSLFLNRKKRIFIIGELDEAKRVSELLKQINSNSDIIGFISPNGNDSYDFIGNFNQVEEIINIFKADEIIFCSKNLTSEEIINRMLQLSNLNISVKIAPEDTFAIIGSNSINLAGDLYTLNLFSLNNKYNKRQKKLFDLFLSILFLFTYPILFLFTKNKLGFLSNIFAVLSFKKSWVGFCKTNKGLTKNLPKIKQGILSTLDILPQNNLLNEKIKHNLNISYAKNYKLSTDLNIIFKGFKFLGRK